MSGLLGIFDFFKHVTGYPEETPVLGEHIYPRQGQLYKIANPALFIAALADPEHVALIQRFFRRKEQLESPPDMSGLKKLAETATHPIFKNSTLQSAETLSKKYTALTKEHADNSGLNIITVLCTAGDAFEISYWENQFLQSYDMYGGGMSSVQYSDVINLSRDHRHASLTDLGLELYDGKHRPYLAIPPDGKPRHEKEGQVLVHRF